jgi:hypothetical protein
MTGFQSCLAILTKWDILQSILQNLKDSPRQHIGTFNRFASLATQCSNNGVQPYWEVCTLKQTVIHVNQSNEILDPQITLPYHIT